MRDIEATVSTGIVEDCQYTIKPCFGTFEMFDPIGVASWLFKWPIFVHTGREIGVCLSRV
ncbi:hypothetical protein F383_21849 [Gossypium arboreum]|uniref:Uncharacterized protein n=1 Tax=Gossypium arboreum TaxID=29729 RepID=A0A0B0NWM6_GOSAR|nr:hypothetical protein F383_21849 [Gossypium arboreum]